MFGIFTLIFLGSFKLIFFSSKKYKELNIFISIRDDLTEPFIFQISSLAL